MWQIQCEKYVTLVHIKLYSSEKDIVRCIESYVTLEHECMLVQMKLHNLERYIVLYY